MQNGSKKKIKVGILQTFSSDWMGGINYFNNLFKAVSMLDNPEIEFYILPQNDINAKKLEKYAKKITLKKNFKYYFMKFTKLIMRKPFDKNKYLIKNSKFDVISHSNPVANQISIAWIPDFQHVCLPKMFSKEEINNRNKSYEAVAKNSNLIFLSSFDALADFKRFIPKYAYKGRVLNFVSTLDENIYELTDSIKEQTIKKYNLPTKYFYLPNQFWKHKNHITVFKAVNELKQQGLEVKVICSGCTNDYRHKEYFDFLNNYIKDNNLQENIICLGIIDSSEVYYLMRNCVSIINPSLFEGWSTTVEETKSLGKNIILSDLDVHKEQNPPEAYYFKRNDYNELAFLMKKNWNTKESSPDYELEKIARENISERMCNFAKCYINIIKEALMGKENL